MDDQWPRALLRAELLEAGYDAVGARTVDEALRLVAARPEGGPVRLVVVEQAAVEGTVSGANDLARVGAGAIKLLLARRGGPLPPGPWDEVFRRPVSIGAIVAGIRASLPLTAAGTGTIE